MAEKGSFYIDTRTNLKTLEVRGAVGTHVMLELLDQMSANTNNEAQRNNLVKVKNSLAESFKSLKQLCEKGGQITHAGEIVGPRYLRKPLDMLYPVTPGILEKVKYVVSEDKVNFFFFSRGRKQSAYGIIKSFEAHIRNSYRDHGASIQGTIKPRTAAEQFLAGITKPLDPPAKKK